MATTKRRRLVPAREAGLTLGGSYWRGTRAEQIVQDRASRALAEAEAKKAARRGPRGERPKRERTPNQRLRRLERNLARRKTLAARQRIALEIKQLKRELGLT